MAVFIYNVSINKSSILNSVHSQNYAIEILVFYYLSVSQPIILKKSTIQWPIHDFDLTYANLLLHN